MPAGARLAPGTALPLSRVPSLDALALQAFVLEAVAAGGRLAALFGRPAPGGLEVVAVIADPALGAVRLAAAPVDGPWPALTPACPEAHLFERELHERWGVEVVGHPCLKPVRFPGARADAGEARPAPGVTDFFRVEGDEVHEVAVGPVHAGVIEPGHFRFQCHGETVLHLEIALGYQHRGVEAALCGGPGPRTVHLLETAAGDTTVAHATAGCQALEALASVQVPARGQALRGIALELERLANHVGDLGALSGDVGYQAPAAFCGRLRGDLLNLTAALCGSRLGRGLVRPGGVAFDASEALAGELAGRLEVLAPAIAEATALLFESPGVRARFEGVGVVSPEDCRALGVVGPAARAAGLARDVRYELPTGIYRLAQIPVSTAGTGDVLARARVRWLEIQRSLAFVRETLAALPGGVVRAPLPPALPANAVAVSCVEGWRGEVWHVALTGDAGELAAYKIVDPSFHNWQALALALRGQAISDFPLCNKSFNLSYCGVDL